MSSCRTAVVYCDVAGEQCDGFIDVPLAVWRDGLSTIYQYVRERNWAALPKSDGRLDGPWLYACPACVREKLFEVTHEPRDAENV